MTPERRSLAWLAGAAVCALAVPAGLSAWIGARVERVERRWSEVLGVPVRLADAEAELGGSLSLSRLRVGEAFAADAVEAGVGLTSLMAGRVRASEINVVRPRLSTRVDASGRADFLNLLERARAARKSSPASGGGGTQLRKIVVSGGELVVSLEGRGELRLGGVELHPHERGVRVIAAHTAGNLRRGKITVSGEFPQLGVDLTWPSLAVDRAVIAGGTLTVASEGAPPLVLPRVVVTKEASGRLRLDGRVGDPDHGPPVVVALFHEGADRVLSVEAGELALGPLASLAPEGVDVSHASAGGKLELRDDGAVFRVRADGAVAGVALTHEVIAKTPIPVDLRLAGEGEWDRRTGEAHASFALQSGQVKLSGELEARLDAGRELRAGRLYLTLPETNCAEALAALPAALRATLDGLVLDGQLAGTAEIAFDRAVKDPAPAVFDVNLTNRCKVMIDAPEAPVAAVAAGGHVHQLPDGRQRRFAVDDPGFVPLSRMPAHVVNAFVAGEDARFFLHRGFDEEQIRKSFEIDVKAGRVERGGSTISQQLAKNLFLERDRTIARKLLEAVLTWRIEGLLGKQRMLEVYLSIIELGPHVYGVEEAAQHWFGKPATRLDLVEAAFLAALTPAPGSISRRIGDADKLDEATRARVDIVLRSMWRNRMIDAPTLNRAAHTPITLKSGRS